MKILILETLIKILTDEGDFVIDPVAGSGSTILACKRTNRDCVGFEVDKQIYKKASELLSL